MLKRREVGARCARRKLGLDGVAGCDRHGKQRPRRGIDETEDRAVMVDQSDVHGEIAALFDELLGAVERVDEEEAFAALALLPVQSLLRDDRNAGRELLESHDDDRFRLRIGERHRARIALERKLGSAVKMPHDRGTRARGGIGENCRRLGKIERGALSGHCVS